MAEKSRWSLGAKLKGLFSRGNDADETVEDIFDDVPSLPRNEEVELQVTPAPEPVVDKPKAEKKPKPEKVVEPVAVAEPEPTVEPAAVTEVVVPDPVVEVVPEPTPEPDDVAEPEPVQEIVEEQVIEEPATAAVVAPKPEKAKPAAKVSRRAAIDEDMWEELEETLLAADFGPDITDELIEVMRANVAKFGTTDPDDFIRLLREAIEDRLNLSLIHI
jgi:fused signal recognition particle receptor